MQDKTMMISAQELTAGGATVLAGTVHHTCGHRFTWLLDYMLTTPENPGRCPVCTGIGARCAVCGYPYNGTTSKSCLACDDYFHESQLPGRRAALVRVGARVADMKPALLAAHAERRLAQARHQREPQQQQQLEEMGASLVKRARLLFEALPPSPPYAAEKRPDLPPEQIEEEAISRHRQHEYGELQKLQKLSEALETSFQKLCAKEEEKVLELPSDTASTSKGRLENTQKK